MRKEFIILVLFILLAYVSFTLISHSTETITEEKAKMYVLQELENITSEGTDVKILFANETDGKWEIKVKLSMHPNDKCPTVQFRVYTVPGLSFRYDPYAVSCNSISPPLAWPEEAQMWLIYSKNNATSNFLAQNIGALAYTSSVKVNEIQGSLARCASNVTPCGAFDLLVSSLPQGEFQGTDSFWVVEWKGYNQSLFVAVNPINGNVLETRIS